MGGKLKKPIKFDFDLLVVGAGSAGCVAANTAAALGKRVAVIEKAKVGGECPNVTCLPTKALLETVKLFRKSQAANRYGVSSSVEPLSSEKVAHYKSKIISQAGLNSEEFAFSDKNIKLLNGPALFLDQYHVKVGHKKLSAKQFLVASGAKPAVPTIKGLSETGYYTYADLALSQNYPASVCFLGGGAVAYEYAQVLSAFGVKVYILEQASHILPGFDPEVGDIAADILARLRVSTHNLVQVTSVGKLNDKKIVEFNKNQRRYRLKVDEIVVCAGKKPNVEIGLENAGVKYDEYGVKINRFGQTNVKNIFAAGEVVGKNFTAGGAIEEARIAIHNMYQPRRKTKINYLPMPKIIYGDPEIASTGISENQVRLSGKLYQTSIAPIGIIGKAITSQYSSGFVKLIADHKGTIIGGSIVAPNASEIINLISFAVKNKTRACDISQTTFATPSWSEALKIAANKIYCI